MLSKVSNFSGPHSSVFKATNIVVDQIRQQLTVAQQSTYDAASVGNWIKVTATQYNNIVSNVTGVTKYRDNDSNFSGSTTPWGSPFFLVGASASAFVPIDNYIIGFRAICARTSENYTWRLHSSNTFSPTGSSWTGVGATVSFIAGLTAGEIGYFIRKAPTTALNVNSYIGIYSSNNLRPSLNSAPTFLSSTIGPPFTTYNSTNAPALQILATTTKSW